jgi:uncharacterized protein
VKRLFFLVCLAFLTFTQAQAATVPQSHPTLWRVTGDKGTVVILGSVHVLPADMNWQTPEIRRAIATADVFVFEIPTDDTTQTKLIHLIADRGRLPQGKTLHGLLSTPARIELDRVLAKLNLPAAAIDGCRPWLAALMIDTELMKTMHQTARGPDFQVSDLAKKNAKEVRYLETADQQLSLLAPADPDIELQYFESTLKTYDEAEAEIAQLTKAWVGGEEATITGLIDKEFAAYPQARAFFLDDRNRVWAEKIAAMAKERKNFFIVVGVGHMGGRYGLPALLRAKGLTVEGP